ncbi:nucleoside monophosphate kinase [Candidatus Wolfebacteria bacterium]|nr:nucleoside monophosphate kinase [Candidatus Wolfebacteria bacterium]
MNFPIFKTKNSEISQVFKLEDPVGRRKYFEAKAGPEIEKLRDYLRDNTFVGFLLGPKGSGKGTYTKLFMEAVGGDRVAHISLGDIVRSVHKELEDPEKKKQLIGFLSERYRGFITIDQALDIILGRDTKTLLPTEIALALLEREISKLEKKAIFIDGFPRNLDQISYSLYFRALIGYRDDPDFFVFINVPEAVISERMKFRVICPKCQTPRNSKLARTKEVQYDENDKQFYLICDNPTCEGYGNSRMVGKEGDSLGIEAIRGRIEVDKKVMETLTSLQGAPKVYLRNSIPVSVSKDYIDDYEITPAYRYEKKENGVEVIEEPWIIKDDEGADSYSLLAPPVAVSLIKQVAQALGL